MKKILIIQLRQLGDILLTTPCIRAIRQQNPSCKIFFLAHQMGLPILKNNPYIDTLITYHEKDTLRQSLSNLRKIRKEKFDLVIDFMNNPRSGLFTFISKAPIRISFESIRNFFYTHTIPRANPPIYIVKEKFLILEPFSYKPGDNSLDIPWEEKDLNPYFKMKLEVKIRSKIQIVIAPCHRREVRKWPNENFARLADLLIEKWDAHVVWISGPGEEVEIRKIQALCRFDSTISPKTSLNELAALMAQFDLFIGNSNGPSHIATAVKIFNLQLHGPTFTSSWCPISPLHQAISPPKNLTDIKEITLHQVWKTLQTWLPRIQRRQEQRNKHKDCIRDWKELK